MPALSVVEGFDGFKHIGLRVFPRGIAGPLNLFNLQGEEEAFHVRGILATPIRVDDQPGLWPTSSHGPDQGLRHQVTGDSLRHRPADHRTGVQVQDDGQTE